MLLISQFSIFLFHFGFFSLFSKTLQFKFQKQNNVLKDFLGIFRPGCSLFILHETKTSTNSRDYEAQFLQEIFDSGSDIIIYTSSLSKLLTDSKVSTYNISSLKNPLNNLKGKHETRKLSSRCTTLITFLYPKTSLSTSSISSTSIEQSDSEVNSELWAKTFYVLLEKELYGFVKKDEDWFIFLSKPNPPLEFVEYDEILTSKSLGLKIKYKIGFEFTETNSLHSLKVACLYYKSGKNISIQNYNTLQEFQDDILINNFLQKGIQNMQGGMIRSSVPLLTRFAYEIVQDSKGRWYGKRGFYYLTHLLLEQTLNFTSTLLPSTGKGTGTFVNGSWIGTVGDVINDKAELGHCTALTLSRYDAVGFSFPFSYERLTFTTGVPKRSFTWRSIYRPLASSVWLPYVLAMIISILAFFLFEINNPTIYQEVNEPSKLGLLVRIIYKIVGSSVEQDTGLEVFKYYKKEIPKKTSKANKILVISWLLFSLIISTAYRSKLITFLAFPENEQPPKTFEELAHSPFQIGLQYIRGAAYNAFKTSKNPIYAKIFSRMELEESDVRCFKRAIESKFGCISWESLADFVKYRNLTDRYGQVGLVKANDATLFNAPGIVMERRAVFKKEMDKTLNWIMDSGIAEKIKSLDIQFILEQRKQWLKEMNRTSEYFNSNNGDQEGDVVLTRDHLSGSFYLLILGNFVAISCLILEKLYFAL